MDSTTNPLRDDAFSSPIDQRYFEDYVPGAVHRFGETRVTEDEIIEFARRYDPQDFHTNPMRAAGTMFGGLIASGWMTCGMMMRMGRKNRGQTTFFCCPLLERAHVCAEKFPGVRWPGFPVEVESMR